MFRVPRWLTVCRFVPVLSVLIAACVTNPATGRRQLMLVSEGQEIAMGREADPSIVASFGEYDDPGLQAYVRRIGNRLASHSERPNLPWTFRVLDDPLVNAFALPGGFNYVTRGILANINSEAELASVMGHEIGHVTARHSASQMSKQTLAQVGLVAGAIFAPDMQNVVGAAQAGLGLLFLRFSRDDERQADDLGLRYMYRAGYDPREMPGVFAMLGRISAASGAGQVPGWLSTHPDPADRQGRLHQRIAALPQDFSATVVQRDEYLRRLDGLTYGQNPREGFFRGTRFFHPELRFQLVFPASWATSNRRSAVLAQSPNKDAVMELTLVQESSPEAAVRAFLTPEPVSGGTVRSLSLKGLPAAEATFRATSDRATVGGRVTAISYGGSVYRILGYASSSRWNDYGEVVRQSMQSFDRLTDPSALAVQPLRLEIVQLRSPMTLGRFAQAFPSKVPMETLALVNGADPGTRFHAGDLVKRVVGGPLP